MDYNYRVSPFEMSIDKCPTHVSHIQMTHALHLHHSLRCWRRQFSREVWLKFNIPSYKTTLEQNGYVEIEYNNIQLYNGYVEIEYNNIQLYICLLLVYIRIVLFL